VQLSAVGSFLSPSMFSIRARTGCNDKCDRFEQARDSYIADRHDGRVRMLLGRGFLAISDRLDDPP
jgi:hypothetical protein